METDQGVELSEATTIAADHVALGVLERKHAIKTTADGRTTASIEVTIHADRADECSPIEFSVRFSVDPGTGWSAPRRTPTRPTSRAAAQRDADRQWAMMLGWLRQATPVARREGANQ